MKKYYILCALSILCSLSLVSGYGMGMAAGVGNDVARSKIASTDNYGMLNGVAGGPVVGSNGTAYLITYSKSQTPTTNGQVFQSTLVAVTLSGQETSITFTGIVSRPVLSSDSTLLFATTSVPDTGQYNMAENLNTSGGNSLSTLYVVQLPLTQNSKPTAVSLDGNYASVPVINNNNIYVLTTDFGGSMMGQSVVSNPNSGNSYLYIINFNGTVVSKTQL